MSRRPAFLSDAAIALAAQKIERMLGPEMSDMARERGIHAEDIVRWQALGRGLSHEREARGWSLKQAAAELRCAQYRLRTLEGSGEGCEPALLWHYAELLELTPFVRAWVRANAELAVRRGLVGSERKTAAGARRKGKTARPRKKGRPGSPSAIYCLQVALLDIDPPVWRRIEVPAEYSFWDLHVAIQDAMGWKDRHLHSFQLLDPKSGKRVEIGIPDPDFPSPDEDRGRAGWREPLAHWLQRRGDRALYVYDYGDDWRHQLEVESIGPPAPNTVYPRCVDGARACPPEDCGGVPGYEELLRALADPTREEHAAMLEWLGGPLDPATFDPSAVRFDDPQARFRHAFGPGAHA